MVQWFDIRRLKFYVWVAVSLFTLQMINDIAQYPAEALGRTINSVWMTIYILTLNYALYELALPFLSGKRYRVFIALLLLPFFILFCSYGLYGWRYLAIQAGFYTSYKSYTTFTEGAFDWLQLALATVVYFGIIKHIVDFRKLKEVAQQLRIEKQEAELNFLKSQTNPHFLFNTLNNIYSLARDKSDQAPESILRLSKILRFMLYETGGAYIAIEDEIKIIGDYVALEKLRYDDSLKVGFQYEVDDMKHPIPPLLLIPLVENAFKHGVSETRGHPFVDIRLSVKNRWLELSVVNSTEKTEPDNAIQEKIGLSNLRRQLELLYTDYHLSVQQQESEFTTVLKINLASHV